MVDVVRANLVAPVWARPRRPVAASLWDTAFALACLVAACAIGASSVLRPQLVLLLAVVLAVLVLVMLRPEFGAYLVVGVTPLTAGIERGSAVPMFRPSEALAVAVGAAVIGSRLVRRRSGTWSFPRLAPVERAILLMALCNSLLPMMWMAARSRPISHDDVLYALVIWKLAGIYLIVRLSITTAGQARRCLWISVASGTVVGAVAILQSLKLFGVPTLLATYYAPFGYAGALDHARGSSTLALPAATGDLMIYNLAVVAGLWLVCRQRQRVVLIALGALFALGTLAAGEFSSAIGLVVGICAIAYVLSYPRLLSVFVPMAAVAAVLLRPVIATRLEGFQSLSGLPVSWTGRLENLNNYFWPVLFDNGQFVMGVRPSARVPVPFQATGYVWIESGYTWLLWGGGLPLLAAFCFFCVAGVRLAWAGARPLSGPVDPAAIALFTSVVVMAVLMIFDPHLTYRGAAEEMFALLALTRLHHLRATGADPVPSAVEVPR